MTALQELFPQLLLWATIFSLGTLLATLVAVPLVIARLPEDYFVGPQRASRHTRRSPLTVFLVILKNALGAMLALLGLLMLVTPGQGLLTLMAGLLLMNFPGKFHLEQAVVARPGVFRALNWLRRSRGQSEFQPPHPPSS